jgi:hypothetical protein
MTKIISTFKDLREVQYSKGVNYYLYENRIFKTTTNFLIVEFAYNKIDELNKIVEILKIFNFDVDYVPLPKLCETAKRCLKIYKDKGYDKIIKQNNGLKVFNRFMHIDDEDETEEEYVRLNELLVPKDFEELLQGISYSLEELLK